MHPGLPIPNGSYGLCRCKATLNLNGLITEKLSFSQNGDAAGNMLPPSSRGASVVRGLEPSWNPPGLLRQRQAHQDLGRGGRQLGVQISLGRCSHAHGSLPWMVPLRELLGQCQLRRHHSHLEPEGWGV